MTEPIASTAAVPRLFSVIRALTEVHPDGGRVTQIARSVGLTQATAHRLLQSLVAEGSPLDDPSGFTKRLTSLLTSAVGK